VFGLINPLYKIIGIIGLVAVLFGTGYYRGYSAEKQRFDAFKAELVASAKAQEKINQQIEQKNKLIADNSKREYDAKITSLRLYYNRLRHPDTNKLPSAAIASPNTDGEASKLLLDCAYTTQQLVSLQDWVLEVSK
jgi:ABC-type nitrate/sulfonate/bicarbonate transport system substrate-binding protein